MIIGLNDFNYNELFKGLISLKKDFKNGCFSEIYIESNCVENISPIALFVFYKDSIAKLGVYSEECFVSNAKKSWKINLKISHLEKYYTDIENATSDKVGVIFMPKYKSFKENIANDLAMITSLNINKNYDSSMIKTLKNINTPIEVLLNNGLGNNKHSNSNLESKIENAVKFCAFTKEESNSLDKTKSKVQNNLENTNVDYIFPELIESSDGEYKDMLKKIDCLSDRTKSSTINSNQNIIYIYTMKCNSINDFDILENKVNSVVKVFLQLFKKNIEEYNHIMLGFIKNKGVLNQKNILIGIPDAKNSLNLNTIGGFKYKKLEHNSNYGYWIYDYEFH